MKQNAWTGLVSRALDTLHTGHELYPDKDFLKNGTIFTISQRALDNDHASTLLEVLSANPDLFYRTPRARAVDDNLTDTVRLVIEETLYEILEDAWNEMRQTS